MDINNAPQPAANRGTDWPEAATRVQSRADLTNFCLYRKPIQTLSIGSSQIIGGAMVSFPAKEGSMLSCFRLGRVDLPQPVLRARPSRESDQAA
jgi:hypothetical protein